MISITGSEVVSGLTGERVIGLNPQTRKPANPQTKKGFTLIEVLMAITVLAIGIIGILRAYSTSVTAMEIAQYNMDAACLLKGVMGDAEEKAIADGGIKSGIWSGEPVSSYAETGDARKSGWTWNKEMRRAYVKAGPAGPRGETENKEEYYLNEVNLTVVNPERNPARSVSLVTYMGSDSAGL